MSGVIKLENVKELIIKVRGQEVLLDSDVAQIYGVETRDINKAVTNNPDKFPVGYVIELSKPEKNELVENFHRFDKLKHSTANPKAFTEKGLYMLATILKSPQAIQATLSIIETLPTPRAATTNKHAPTRQNQRRRPPWPCRARPGSPPRRRQSGRDTGEQHLSGRVHPPELGHPNWSAP